MALPVMGVADTVLGALTEVGVKGGGADTPTYSQNKQRYLQIKPIGL